MRNHKRPRAIVSFQPSDPIRAMMQSEVKGRIRGSQTRLIENSVAKLVGHKYPKLLGEFKRLYRYA